MVSRSFFPPASGRRACRRRKDAAAFSKSALDVLQVARAFFLVSPGCSSVKPVQRGLEAGQTEQKRRSNGRREEHDSQALSYHCILYRRSAKSSRLTCCAGSPSCFHNSTAASTSLPLSAMPTSLPSLAVRAVISVYVPLSAFRKGSLNKSGASLAFVFAHTTLVLCSTTVFAVSLLTFFFLGSRATKYKASVKAKLEEQHHAPASHSKESKQKNLTAGNRDAKQVACNGLLGTLACAVWIVACPEVKRPVARAGLSQGQRLSNAMVFMALGYVQCHVGLMRRS